MRTSYDQVDAGTLASRIITMLAAGDALVKRRFIDDLHSHLAVVDATLAQLQRDGIVESFEARSCRGRMDIFWRLAPDESSVDETPVSTINFHGSENLAALQAATLHAIQQSNARGAA